MNQVHFVSLKWQAVKTDFNSANQLEFSNNQRPDEIFTTWICVDAKEEPIAQVSRILGSTESDEDLRVKLTKLYREPIRQVLQMHAHETSPRAFLNDLPECSQQFTARVGDTIKAFHVLYRFTVEVRRCASDASARLRSVSNHGGLCQQRFGGRLFGCFLWFGVCHQTGRRWFQDGHLAIME